ncbi:MAG: long-chain fatty acid--CoA ligase [Elusimicrobiota bacterium]
MTLNGLLDHTASIWPHKPALVLPGDRVVSFGELRSLVLRAAALLRSRGVGKGDRFALVLRNGLEFVVGYFALARLGAAAVPINFLVQKPEELQFMLGHCKAKGVLTQKEFLRPLRDIEGVFVLVAEEGFWRDVEASPESETGFPEVSEDDLACVLYTSGTTGQPKGVMLTHANLVSNCDACIQALGLENLSRSDVMMTILPMFHTFAWTACVLLPLRGGAKNIVSPSITPAAAWLRMMSKHGATLIAAVPQVYAVLAKEAKGLKGLALRWWFFRRTWLFVSGAAPLSPKTAEDFRSAFGKGIIEGYGLTETSPVATVNAVDSPRPGSVGKALPGVELRIADDSGAPLPVGEEGEILIRGPNVMKGYLDDPEATAAAISPEGWLRTGDIGTLDADGYLFIRDRKKDMVIVKGLKVFPAQVEAVLTSHPDVEEAAVIGIPDETGDETLKAFIVTRKGCAADKAGLLEFCRSKLDPYKRPRDIELVDELPKNSLQKVLKRVLREREKLKRC